ncbi:MAG: hypothetical protein DMG79_06130 [Acidobacteria bacterium]|nr:MAG: hypothetical protein DMG79_06130 [Acidobacteriota bacterium]
MVVVTSSARSGLMVENITPQLGEFFGVKNGNGVLVRSVEKGSRAEKAGIRAGDVIVKVNDQPVHDTSDFAHAVKSRSGNSVSVGVIRERKEQNLNLTLPERKESGDLMDDEESLQGPVIDAESGDEFADLQQEIAQLQPHMELAFDDADGPVMELRGDLCKEQKKLRQQREKMRYEFRLHSKKNQEKLKLEFEQMGQDFGGHYLDL